MSDPVFIAVPAYPGDIRPETAVSLAAACVEAERLKRPATLRVRPGDSLLTRGRNVLVKQFLDSGAEILVFWDADIACAPGDFERLLTAEQPIVAGAYRFRADPEDYPIRPLPGGWRSEDGLIEVEAVAAGFLCVTRAAIQTMIAARPGAWFNDREAGRTPILFENLVRDHELYSEDFTFCARARECGLPIFLDPAIRLTHGGGKVFAGDFHRWLGRRLAAATSPQTLDASRARLSRAYAAAGGR